MQPQEQQSRSSCFFLLDVADLLCSISFLLPSFFSLLFFFFFFFLPSPLPSSLRELWGLAAHPFHNGFFATSGDDRTVRIWHIGARECVCMSASDALPDMSRALVYEPSTASFLVAGLGGRLGGRKVGTQSKKAGSIVSLSSKTLTVMCELSVAKEQISDLRFTSDGGTLCVGSNDNLIYLVAVQSSTSMSVKKKMTGHSSYVTRMTVSEDDKWLLSNDGAGEMLFWNLEREEREPDADVMAASASWPGNTCPLSWETIGVWPHDGDLTDVNASCASPEEFGMIVTADDDGKIKTFNSPSTSFYAPFFEHVGHSSHVTNVVFNCTGDRVISIGGADLCAFVWTVVEVGGGRGGGMGGGRVGGGNEKKKKHPSKCSGDDFLDSENELPERSSKQTREMAIVRGKPPATIDEEGRMLIPSLTVVGRLVKPKRQQKVRAQRGR